MLFFFFFFLTPSLTIKSGGCCFCFVFVFIVTPSALDREEEGRPPSGSPGTGTSFDVPGFLGLGSRPVMVLLRDHQAVSLGLYPTEPYPAQFGLASSFLEDLTEYRLSSSNLATGFFAASNRWPRRKGCNRLVAYMAPFQEEKPYSFPEATSYTHSLDRMSLPIRMN